MNPPRAVRGQAIALAAGSILGALTDLWLNTLGLIALMLVEALALNAWYSHSLHERCRRKERVEDDAEIARQVVLLLLVAAAAVAAGRIWDAPLTGSRYVAWSLQCVVVFCWAMYASSLIDWYAIRPRRDGVVCDPPCQSSGDRKWFSVTRWWYRHRCVTAAVCFLAAAAGVGFLLLALVGTSTAPSGLVTAGLFLGGVAVAERMMKLFYGSLAEIGFVFTSCVINPPDHALGQRLVSKDEGAGTFIRDVAPEAVVCIPLDANQRPIDPSSAINTPVKEVVGKRELERKPYGGCQVHCWKVNEHCQWIDPADRRRRRPGRFVIGRDVDADTGQRIDGYEDEPEQQPYIVA